MWLVFCIVIALCMRETFGGAITLQLQDSSAVDSCLLGLIKEKGIENISRVGDNELTFDTTAPYPALLDVCVDVNGITFSPGTSTSMNVTMDFDSVADCTAMAASISRIRSNLSVTESVIQCDEYTMQIGLFDPTDASASFTLETESENGFPWASATLTYGPAGYTPPGPPVFPTNCGNDFRILFNDLSVVVDCMNWLSLHNSVTNLCNYDDYTVTWDVLDGHGVATTVDLQQCGQNVSAITAFLPSADYHQMSWHFANPSTCVRAVEQLTSVMQDSSTVTTYCASKQGPTNHIDFAFAEAESFVSLSLSQNGYFPVLTLTLT